MTTFLQLIRYRQEQIEQSQTRLRAAYEKIEPGSPTALINEANQNNYRGQSLGLHQAASFFGTVIQERLAALRVEAGMAGQEDLIKIEARMQELSHLLADGGL